MFEPKDEKRGNLYPILIVDNLPKDFGNIDKNNKVDAEKLTDSERILLTLIAKIIVEITLNEEL